MATYSIFTSQTPSVTDADDGTPRIGVCTTVRIDTDGQVTHFRWFCTTSTGGTWTGVLWKMFNASAGNRVGLQAHPGTPIGGAWNLIALDTPVDVVAGDVYRVEIYNDQGRYVASGAGFSAAIDNGPLHAYADGEIEPAYGNAILQGTFIITADSPSTSGFPNGSFNSANYFADLVFAEPGGTTVDAAADLAASTGLSAGGVRAVPAAVVLSAGSALQAQAVAISGAAATLSGASNLTATAVPDRQAIAALTAASNLATAAIPDRPVTGALTAASNLTVAAITLVPATAALSAGSVMAAAPVGAGDAETQLSAGTAIAAGAITMKAGAAALSALSELSIAGGAQATGTAVLSAQSLLSPSGSSDLAGQAPLGAASGLAVSGFRQAFAVAPLSGASQLSAATSSSWPGASVLSAASGLIALAGTARPLRAYAHQVIDTRRRDEVYPAASVGVANVRRTA